MDGIENYILFLFIVTFVIGLAGIYYFMYIIYYYETTYFLCNFFYKIVITIRLDSILYFIHLSYLTFGNFCQFSLKNAF